VEAEGAHESCSLYKETEELVACRDTLEHVLRQPWREFPCKLSLSAGEKGAPATGTTLSALHHLDIFTRKSLSEVQLPQMLYMLNRYCL
jgi:hypothetical protein